MKLFGYEDIAETLSGAGIHAIDNVLTMDSAIHDIFDTLRLLLKVSHFERFVNFTDSLQPVEGQKDTYDIQAFTSDNLEHCKPSPIVLSSQDLNLPQPNWTYFEIHATCCRVAHLSDAAKYIEKLLNLDGKGNSQVLFEWAEWLILAPVVSYWIIYQLFLMPAFGMLLSLRNILLYTQVALT